MLIIDSQNFLPPSYREIFGALPEYFLPIGTTNLLFHSIKFLDPDLVFVISPERYNMPQSSELYPDNVKFFNSNEILYDYLNTIYMSRDEDIQFIHSLALYKNKDLSNISFYQEKIAQSIELPPFISEFKSTEIEFNNLTQQISSHNIFQNQLIDPSYNPIGSVNLRFSSNYFNARIHLVSIRFFNSLSCFDNKLKKTVDNRIKAYNESNWYQNVSKVLPHRVPSLIEPCSYDGNAYIIEYLPMVSLSEIYTFGILEANQWISILYDIKNLVHELRAKSEVTIINTEKTKSQLDFLLFDKTYERFKMYCDQLQLSIDSEIYYNGVKVCNNISEIISTCKNIMNKHDVITSIFHGDLCLSNILYDSRTSFLKLIDPRGIANTNKNSSPDELYGPLNYDLAKLAHSLIGNYDLIIAGRMGNASISYRRNTLHIENVISIDDYHRSIIKTAEEFQITEEFHISDFYPSCVMLFLSMLPLHTDCEQRQSNLFANALNLYLEKVL